MSNFFFRQSDLKQSDFETSARVRNNAYVRILDDKGVQILPVDLQNSTTKRDSTANTLNYSGQMLGPSAVGTGKPAPILGEVKIALEGEYGSLKKAEFSFVCFDQTCSWVDCSGSRITFGTAPTLMDVYFSLSLIDLFPIDSPGGTLLGFGYHPGCAGFCVQAQVTQLVSI